MKIYVLDIKNYNGRYTLCVVAEDSAQAFKLIRDKIDWKLYEEVASDIDGTWTHSSPLELSEKDLKTYKMEDVLIFDNIQ